ncbi:CHAP domain-containing protein [Paenibacillus massiliensis]|uniref:CHAP domain-containing protein n=1 Tax=Paenibacillus massiliensis TaxID=225917 RepID=UPI00046ED5C8|nr:CHAP domain-containing protein [Paenibacillus massiliensis]
MTNKRLESIRILVQEMINSMDSEVHRQEACTQLYGVSNMASLLAKRRDQNQEIAAISGLLHDYYHFNTGIIEFPGTNSAETVRPILRELNAFTSEEQTTILRAIFYRDYRNQTHGPFDEILKDAYVLHSYFQNPSCIVQQDADRLRKIFRELAIPEDCSVEESSKAEVAVSNADKRLRMAEIAEDLGRANIIGMPGDQRYREICKYWPDREIYKALQNNWCAAFVYHCCFEAGFLLPIRYPNGKYRLAGVGALLEWGQLPETGYFCMDKHNGFVPQRGDIVIYEKLLSNDSHDHIGIVLACNDNEILVAEGNRDNQNYSSVFYRDRWHCILGYIRIDNNYEYHFNGVYNPII